MLTKLRRLNRYRRWWLLLAGLSLPGLVLAWRFWLTVTYRASTFTTLADVPPHRVALVFGAGVRHNRPSAALADRDAKRAEELMREHLRFCYLINKAKIELYEDIVQDEKLTGKKQRKGV